jgi:hypothetical protein
MSNGMFREQLILDLLLLLILLELLVHNTITIK